LSRPVIKEMMGDSDLSLVVCFTYKELGFAVVGVDDFGFKLSIMPEISGAVVLRPVEC